MSKENVIEYKMTLDDFFEAYKKHGIKLAIECPSICEAYVLCHTFDKLGLKSNGRRFIKEPVDEWEDEDEPVYWQDETLYANFDKDGQRMFWKSALNKQNVKLKIINFYDVDFTDYAEEWMFMVYKNDGLKRIWETIPHENPDEKYYNALDEFFADLMKKQEEKEKNSSKEEEMEFTK